MYNITVGINSGTPGDPINEDLVIRPGSEIARSKNGNVIAKRQGDFAEDTQIPDLKWVAEDTQTPDRYLTLLKTHRPWQITDFAEDTQTLADT